MSADMEKRIEAAARALYKWDDPRDEQGWDAETPDWYRNKVTEFLAAAFPELFTDPPTMWLAPVDLSDAGAQILRQELRKGGLMPAYTDEGPRGQKPVLHHLLQEAWPGLQAHLSSAPEEERDNG